MDRQQGIRLKNTLLAAIGGAALTVGVVYASFRGFILIPSAFVALLCVFFWLVNVFVVALITSSYNTRFRDPSMSVFQMYWASLSATVAFLFTLNIDALFYLLILLPMVFGVFRVSVKQFQTYTIAVIAALFFANIARFFMAPNSVDMFNVFVVWLSFSFCAVTLSILCKSVIKLQERLREKNEALQHALEARAYFLANMSHEIRTPMNGVLGMLDISLRKDISEELRHTLLVAKNSSKALLTIINDILDFSKIEAGKLELNPIAFDLPAFLQDLLSPFEAVAQTNEVELLLNCEQDLARSVVLDCSRLRQILNNIIGNAVKFTTRGSVHVNVSTVLHDEEEKGKITLNFIVADTGIGIAQDKIESLFDHFTQADITTTREYGGTGLGLAIAKSLCELMGGRIFVCSEEGVGSTFKLSVDAILSTEEEIPTADVESLATKFRQKPRILLVEDNITNQEVAKMTLEDLGAYVQVANHGVEALEFLAKKGASHPVYDLIFMDCQMPLLDGYETTKIIRTNTDYLPYVNTPVVAMTAHAMQGDKEKCLAEGMSDYTAKPIDISKLSGILNRWLGFFVNTDANESESPDPVVDKEKTEMNQDQIWDQEKLLKVVGGKPERITKLLTNFSKTFDEQTGSILDVIETKDFEKIYQLAHGLKGATANLRFDRMSGVCKKIEFQASEEAAGIESLREEFSVEVNNIKKIFKEMDLLL